MAQRIWCSVLTLSFRMKFTLNLFSQPLGIDPIPLAAPILRTNRRIRSWSQGRTQVIKRQVGNRLSKKVPNLHLAPSNAGSLVVSLVTLNNWTAPTSKLQLRSAAYSSTATPLCWSIPRILLFGAPKYFSFIWTLYQTRVKYLWHLQKAVLAPQNLKNLLSKINLSLRYSSRSRQLPWKPQFHTLKL